jgi:GNAT superfamily N-acetyltransferase
VVRVRDAQLDDATAIAELLGQLGYPASADQAKARLSRLDADPSARVLLAEDDGHVAGLAVTYVEPLIEHDRPVLRLQALAVGERFRRRGVGRALVQAIEDEARSGGCFAIVLTSADRRADAHAFYLSVGFDRTGRRFVKDV